MSNIKQEILFTKGKLDTDTDPRYIENGSSDYRLNCIFSQMGNYGIIYNSKGNELKTLTLPVGTNQTIFTLKDLQNNGFIYFVYNSNSYHCIIRYLIDTDTFQKIIWSNSDLNFSLTYPVTHANIIGNYLKWVDGYNPNRQIDIERAIIYTERPGTTLNVSLVQFNSNILTVATTTEHHITEGGWVYLNSGVTKYNGFYKVKDQTYSANSLILNYYGSNQGTGSGTITKITGTPYKTITEQELNVAQYPPARRPVCLGFYDSNIKINNIIGKLFQFSYRYVYSDFSKSVFSIPSNIIIDTSSGNDFSYTGESYLFKNPDSINGISVFFEYGSQDAIYVEMAFREGNNGQFFLLDRIKHDPDNGSQRFVQFFNNEQYTEISNEEVLKPYEDIPKCSGCQEAIKDEYIVYGKNTKGYANVDIDVALASRFNYYHNRRPTVAAYSWNIATKFNYAYTGNDFACDYYYGFPLTAATHSPTRYNYIEIKFKYNLEEKSRFYYVANAISTVPAFKTFLYNCLLDFEEFGTPLNSGFAAIIGNSNITDSDIGFKTKKSYNSKPIAFSIQMIEYTGTTGYMSNNYIKGSKSGSKENYGLVYFDRAMRSTGVNVSENSSIDIPLRNAATLQYYPVVDWTITHLPPDWATHYCWYKTDLTPNFVQYNSETYFTKDGKTHISINRLMGHNPSDNVTYQFQKGDRVRFLAYRGSSTTWYSFDTLLDYEIQALEEGRVEQKYDVEFNIDNSSGLTYSVAYGTFKDVVPVISTPYVAQRIVVNDISSILNVPGQLHTELFMEIYTPIKTTELATYFQFSDIYEIYETSGVNYHRGHTQDQTSGQPAKGTFSEGDTFYLFRTMKGCNTFGRYDEIADINTVDNSKAFGLFLVLVPFPPHATKYTYYDFASNNLSIHLVNDTFYLTSPLIQITSITPAYYEYHTVSEIGNWPVESKSYSDSQKIEGWNKGKINVPIERVSVGTFQSLQLSNKFLPYTEVNGLCTFDWQNNITTFAARYGDIYKIILIGDILKIYQKRKVSSIYIGKVEQRFADGNTSLIAIEQVLGSRNESETSYGTVNPESVVSNNRHVYFVDIYNGEILRDSSNGVQPLGELYGVKKYLKSKCSALLQSGIGYIKIYSDFDELTGMLYVSFVDNYDSTNNDTIGFHEPSNTWQLYVPFIPENISSNGLSTISFKSGQLYLHNSDNVSRNNFYGVQYSTTIKVIANLDSNFNKIFKSLIIDSNKSWNISVYIPPNSKYPRGMTSIINSSEFVNKEGKWFAAFKRNMLTSSNIESLRDLNNGDMLRGEYAEITLTNEDTEEVWLRQVDVNFLISK
jgi:hypothetical protein